MFLKILKPRSPLKPVISSGAGLYTLEWAPALYQEEEDIPVSSWYVTFVEINRFLWWGLVLKIALVFLIQMCYKSIRYVDNFRLCAQFRMWKAVKASSEALPFSRKMDTLLAFPRWSVSLRKRGNFLHNKYNNKMIFSTHPNFLLYNVFS